MSGGCKCSISVEQKLKTESDVCNSGFLVIIFKIYFLGCFNTKTRHLITALGKGDTTSIGHWAGRNVEESLASVTHIGREF